MRNSSPAWAPIVLLSSMALSGCQNAFGAPTKPQTAVEFCASKPTAGFGHLFYCGTTQANLQLEQFPDGALGYCMTADTNSLGLVGYSAHTSNGGAFPVKSQSRASADCGTVAIGCSYSTCNRE